MPHHALQIISDDAGNFRWILLTPTDNALVFEAFQAADYDFSTYQAALDAGAVALSAADGEHYRNEAAIPMDSPDASLDDGEDGAGARQPPLDPAGT
ncbi:hypothetical protein GN316_06765 [Xylophilus sp. Kf1]|nr:hypothetical protein [Xylophilus sp. Kf1]